MTSLSLTDRGISQEIPEPYLVLLLYTPRSQASRLLSELSDRRHSSLIWLETGIKKGLFAAGRVRCSVYSVKRKLHPMHFFGLYHLKLLYIKLLTLFIQRKKYFILKEEKGSCSFVTFN